MLSVIRTRLLPDLVNFRIAEIRQAWRSGIVAVVCLAISNYFFHSESAQWILVTALICLQANFGATLRKSKQRLVGTVLGCALAFLVTLIFPENYTVFLVVLLLAVLLGVYNSLRSYTYSIFFYTMAILMLYFSLTKSDISVALLRIKDVSLGALFGTAGSILLWPSFARKSFQTDLEDVIKQMDLFFMIVIHWIDGKKSPEDVYKQKVASATSNQTARSRLVEIFYEIGSHRFPLKDYESFVLSQDRIHYALLTVYNTLRKTVFAGETTNSPNFHISRQKLMKIRTIYAHTLQDLPIAKNIIFSDLHQFDHCFVQNPIQFLFSHEITLESALKRLYEEVRLMSRKVEKLSSQHLRHMQHSR